MIYLRYSMSEQALVPIQIVNKKIHLGKKRSISYLPELELELSLSLSLELSLSLDTFLILFLAGLFPFFFRWDDLGDVGVDGGTTTGGR